MKKRKFGMACLNISQGRFNSYSHKNLNAYDLCGMDSGIDRFKTFNDLEVIGIHEYSKTGFANTVCFYDKENDVTLAMSHMNTLTGYYVGKRFHNGDTIYYEGTKGQATGNHIHLELGRGYQKAKTKINGVWQLKDLINIENYFYIDKEYTEERNNNGYVFSYEEGEKMNLVEGLNKVKWLGSDVEIYYPAKRLRLGMMSATQSSKENWQAVQTIDKIDNNYIHYCKVNCNFFNMQDGQHYGVEQSFTNDFAPKQEDWYCLYVDHEGEPHYCISSDYYYGKKDVKFASSPYAILRHNGVDVLKTSKAVNRSLDYKTNNTLLLYFGEGRYSLVTTDSNLNSRQCLDLAKAYGAIGAYSYDGGKSTQMIVNGKKVRYTERAVPNVLTFYELPNAPVEPPKEEPCKNCKVLQGKVEELTQKNESLMSENNNLRDENLMLANKLNRIKDITEE